MKGIRIIRSISRVRICFRSGFGATYMRPFLYTASVNEVTSTNSIRDVRFPLHFSSYSASNDETPTASRIAKPEQKCSSHDDNDSDSDTATDDTDDDDGEVDIDLADVKQDVISDEELARDVKSILDLLSGFQNKRSEMKIKIEQCGIKVSHELVIEVLSRVRNDWEAAFTFFLWAEKQPGYAHSSRQFHAMISILAKMRKFDTAWSLIDQMRGAIAGPSLVTKQTLLIMIRRYCAVHDVGKAINVFYAHKKFKFDASINDFQNLLSALCRYKNVQDAEHLMFCNKDVFPFNTKSFNIILNGWCNIISSPREAERVWREMSKRGIRHDVVSFSSIISCYSKSHNLYKVLRLFDQMKKMNIEPDRKVYNAVIHALAKGRLVNEAITLMQSMEEKGIAPNIVTYNSLIKPLCKARKVDEARKAFDEMLRRRLSPTIQTFHAFLRILRTGEEVFELLENMRNMGCKPTQDTYIMLIRKFSRWCQFDNVFKVWDEMQENGIGHDRSSYIVLIHGLFLNGKLEEAYKYYMEMKEKGLLPEPKTDEMLRSWFSNKQFAESRMANIKVNQHQSGNHVRAIKFDQERDFVRRPETRGVVRERGFSFWDK